MLKPRNAISDLMRNDIITYGRVDGMARQRPGFHQATRLAPALVALVMARAACGGASGPKHSTAIPARGGTLRVGLLFTDELAHYTKLPPGYDYFLDPQAGYTPQEIELFRCCLARTLLSYNGHPTAQGGAELHPDLAVSMPEISQDRLTWTFQLKQGLHYAPPLAHTEIRAQDIVRARGRCADYGSWQWGA